MPTPERIGASDTSGIDSSEIFRFCLNLCVFFVVCMFFFKGAAVPREPAMDTTGRIIIAIGPDGRIRLNEREIDLREVRDTITQLHVDRPSEAVVILADERAQSQTISKVVDQVRLAGATLAQAPTAG